MAVCQTSQQQTITIDKQTHIYYILAPVEVFLSKVL